MDEKSWLEKLESKLDKHDEEFSIIKDILVRNTLSLEYHIKRTDLSEKAVGLLQELVTQNKIESDMAISKMERNWDRVTFLGWFIGFAATIAESAHYLHLFH